MAGMIQADGDVSQDGAGGGSGGGILLKTGLLFGKGTIRTNGGQGRNEFAKYLLLQINSYQNLMNF